MAMEDDMPTTASSAAGGQQEPGKSRSVDHDALDSEIEKQRSIALQVSLFPPPPFFSLALDLLSSPAHALVTYESFSRNLRCGSMSQMACSKILSLALCYRLPHHRCKKMFSRCAVFESSCLEQGVGRKLGLGIITSPIKL